MRHLLPLTLLAASFVATGCQYDTTAGHDFDEPANPEQATHGTETESSPGLDLAANAEPLSDSTDSYYVIHGKPNSTLQLCSTPGCASEGFYMRYNEPNNEFSIISRHQDVFNDRLVIERDNGRVGIGTNAPRQALDVNGTIQAKKIIVENTTADYVFEEGYKLRSLAEVEAFIEKEGHLPEVPNAEQVAKQGTDLGRNQTLLLQKLEELTLYAIEQQKAIAALQRQVAQSKD